MLAATFERQLEPKPEYGSLLRPRKRIDDSSELSNEAQTTTSIDDGFWNAVQPLASWKPQTLLNQTVVSPVSSGESLTVKPLQSGKLSQWVLAAAIVIVLFSMSLLAGMYPSWNTFHAPGVGVGDGVGDGVGEGVGDGVGDGVGLGWTS